MTRTTLALALAATALPLVAGCGKSAPSAGETAPVAAATATPQASAGTPIDHLAPGELVEGSMQAFGIPLPRELRVDQSYPDVVYASGPVTIHSVVKYFRAHIQDGNLREGDLAASFEHVKVLGKPGLELAIQIRASVPGVRVEIHEATPSPAPDLPDEAARWRQVGLTPDGRILDPTHLD
ncbi:MAG TPA: hypothetical protein VIF15_17310 [Polyangiaceae bacterium]